MKVRIKLGKTIFFNTKLHHEGDEIILTPRKHSTQTDREGKPVVITVEQQFNKDVMEKVNVAQNTPGKEEKDNKETKKK